MSDDTNTPTDADSTQDQVDNPPAETATDDAIVPDDPLALAEANWKRAVADLQNYRRQAEEDKQQFARFASEKAVLAVLPALDSLQRSSAHVPAELADTEFIKGITATQSQLEQGLASFGVAKIVSETGTPVDPSRHQAIGTGPGEQGSIIECFEEGYELGGKVIRLAKVRTGDGSEAA